jgi:iron complex transport system ATP-binding protein
MMLAVDGMHFGYNSKPVLQDMSFNVERGELCSILGNNGAGKSTLLKCILSILHPQAGTVFIDEEDAARLSRMEMARRVGYVAQKEGGNARLTVFDAVLMGRRPHINWGTSEGDLEVVQEVMEALELEDLSLRYLDQLSGGELQKVVIARALAQEPGIMLLDEPTSNLDLRNQLEVMETVSRAVAQRGIAALMAIHDVNLALRFSHKFMLLKNGMIFACGGSEVIDSEAVEEVYGVRVKIELMGENKIVIPLQAVEAKKETEEK